MLLGTIVFILAIYFIGNKQDLFGRTVAIHALFNNVNGLQPGNNVRYSGIDIGTVRRIEMINDTSIRVEMAIDRKIIRHIKTNAVATIGSDGLVGSMVLNIIPGEGNQPPVSEGGTIMSFNRVSTEDMLKTLTVTNENAAQLTADLLKITKRITDGKGTVSMLLNDTSVSSDMKQTVHYLKVSSYETSVAMNRISKLINELDQKDNTIGMLKDTVLSGRMKRIALNLEASTEALEKTVGKLDEVAVKLRDGQGAINYLASDPKSAQKVDSLLTNINKASILLKEDLEAAKHNFLLRGYFKKQERERKKAEKKQ